MIANTWSGRTFDPLQPHASSICIEDIAHALSLQSRFGGHTDRFYSVAQHSVIVSHLVPPQHGLTALLHDAEEAYLGDVIQPLKATGAMERFQLISAVWRTVILQTFGLPGELAESVHAVDRAILINEGRALFTHVPPWAAAGEPLALPAHVGSWLRDPWRPEFAERMFLDQFSSLRGAK